MDHLGDLLDGGVLQGGAVDERAVLVVLVGLVQGRSGFEGARVEIATFGVRGMAHEAAWVGSIDSHVLDGDAIVEFVHEVVEFGHLLGVGSGGAFLHGLGFVRQVFTIGTL